MRSPRVLLPVAFAALTALALLCAQPFVDPNRIDANRIDPNRVDTVW